MFRLLLVFVAALAVTPIACRPPAKPTFDLPFDSPYQVDYPLYAGSVKDFIPQKVGAFTLTESDSAIATPPALEAWSAFFKSSDGHVVQLRIYRCANAAAAFEKISGERVASLGVPQGAVRHEPATSKGKIAGTMAEARYQNKVKGVEGDVIWCTRGNIAFVVTSSDGVHAETFWREFERTLPY